MEIWRRKWRGKWRKIVGNKEDEAEKKAGGKWNVLGLCMLLGVRGGFLLDSDWCLVFEVFREEWGGVLGFLAGIYGKGMVGLVAVIAGALTWWHVGGFDWLDGVVCIINRFECMVYILILNRDISVRLDWDDNY